MSREAPWCVVGSHLHIVWRQAGKRKQGAPAPALSQAALSACMDCTGEDAEAARREAEVRLTTELIERFQQHSAAWEAIEVSSARRNSGYAPFDHHFLFKLHAKHGKRSR